MNFLTSTRKGGKWRSKSKKMCLWNTNALGGNKVQTALFSIKVTVIVTQSHLGVINYKVFFRDWMWKKSKRDFFHRKRILRLKVLDMNSSKLLQLKLYCDIIYKLPGICRSPQRRIRLHVMLGKVQPFDITRNHYLKMAQCTKSASYVTDLRWRNYAMIVWILQKIRPSMTIGNVSFSWSKLLHIFLSTL